MKKYLFLLLIVMSFVTLLAVESDPSATVGYFKTTVAPGDWVPFGLPFGYDDLSCDAVLGTYFPAGVLVSDFVSGDYAEFYIMEGFTGWDGLYSGMAYGASYWLNNPTATTFDFFIMGTVSPSPLTIHVSGQDEQGWSPFTLNEARPVDISTLEIGGAVDQDIISNLMTGEYAQYYVIGEWEGWDNSSMPYIMPTQVYWYNSYADESFDWDYTPPSRSAVVTTPAAPRLRSGRTEKFDLRGNK